MISGKEQIGHTRDCLIVVDKYGRVTPSHSFQRIILGEVIPIAVGLRVRHYNLVTDANGLYGALSLSLSLSLMISIRLGRCLRRRCGCYVRSFHAWPPISSRRRSPIIRNPLNSAILTQVVSALEASRFRIIRPKASRRRTVYVGEEKRQILSAFSVWPLLGLTQQQASSTWPRVNYPPTAGHAQPARTRSMTSPMTCRWWRWWRISLRNFSSSDAGRPPNAEHHLSAVGCDLPTKR